MKSSLAFAIISGIAMPWLSGQTVPQQAPVPDPAPPPVVSPHDESAASAPEEEAAPEAPQPSKPTLKNPAVRVEKLTTRSGQIDPAEVKLLAAFPSKPLGAIPAGWSLQESDSAAPIIREVTLATGKKITLKIRPHLLVPIADGTQVFTIVEPGYQAALGPHQSTTVSAILNHTIRQLDQDTENLGDTIEVLQKLLEPLPVPVPEPKPVPAPEPPKPEVPHKR